MLVHFLGHNFELVALPAIVLIGGFLRHLMPHWITDRLGWAHLTLKDWNW
jgi:hypothetical protein